MFEPRLLFWTTLTDVTPRHRTAKLFTWVWILLTKAPKQTSTRMIQLSCSSYLTTCSFFLRLFILSPIFRWPGDPSSTFYSWYDFFFYSTRFKIKKWLSACQAVNVRFQLMWRFRKLIKAAVSWGSILRASLFLTNQLSLKQLDAHPNLFLGSRIANGGGFFGFVF